MCQHTQTAAMFRFTVIYYIFLIVMAIGEAYMCIMDNDNIRNSSNALLLFTNKSFHALPPYAPSVDVKHFLYKGNLSHNNLFTLQGTVLH